MYIGKLFMRFWQKSVL